MELKRGQMAVNKTALLAFVQVVQRYEQLMDETMKLPSSVERGKTIAGLINTLTFARQSFQLHELNVPLKKLK